MIYVFLFSRPCTAWKGAAAQFLPRPLALIGIFLRCSAVFQGGDWTITSQNQQRYQHKERTKSSLFNSDREWLKRTNTWGNIVVFFLSAVIWPQRLEEVIPSDNMALSRPKCRICNSGKAGVLERGGPCSGLNLWKPESALLSRLKSIIS